MSIKTFIKDPQSVLSYSINWASEDGTNDGTAADTGWLQGDTIATSAWAVSGPDAVLVEGANSNSTTVATVTLSAGTVSRDYTVTNTITTAGGFTDERSLTIKVRNR